MATAIANVASSSKVVQPASSFAHLLRRSRFASYDPVIGQTYCTPQAHAHRGNWGVKRPLKKRGKDSYITIPVFEDRAHYTKWNNAESSVRFIRRFEEMGTLPRILNGTPWYKALGRAQSLWLMDSDFCEGDYASLENPPETVLSEPEPQSNLNGLGKKGPGQYGPGRENRSHVVPNIAAMSPRQFRRYIRNLRTLRPEFQAFLAERGEKEKKKEGEKHEGKHGGKELQIANKSLFELSQNLSDAHHRQFLMEHTESRLRSSQGIEPQPHRTGALLYTHPSPIDTFFHTKAQPGFILTSRVQPGSTFTQNQARPEEFVVSFGGLTPILSKLDAKDKVPLLDIDSEQGLSNLPIKHSIANMRLLLKNGLVLEKPPNVVGHYGEDLEGVKLKAEVSTKSEWKDHGRDNTYVPGTRNYSGMYSSEDQSKVMPITQSGWLTKVLNTKSSTASRPLMNETPTANNKILGVLSGMVTDNQKVGDPDLDSNL